jgi:predicted enzyme related to lactoylglutathione lyase
MSGARLSLIEFPADDPVRARAFWEGLLGAELHERTAGQGSGRQSAAADGPVVGVHARGRGPGDTQSLPYFEVDDMAGALARVLKLGGTHVHPGASWSICRDSEGTPFALAAAPS